MKTTARYIIPLFFLLISSRFTLLAQSVSYIQSDSRSLIITFEPNGLQKENVITGNDTFIRFICPGSGTTSVIGHPALPVFQRQILQSPSAIKNIEILSLNTESIHLKQKVVPFYLPPSRGREYPPTGLVTDSLVYSADGFLPEVFYETGSEYTYAGIPQFDIRLYPLQYNPATGQAVLIKKAVIRITFKDEPLKAMAGNISPSYSNQLLTSGAIQLTGKTRSDSIPPTLLIVTHASLYDQARKFADWKMKMGINTQIIKTSDISMNPDADQIKAYIIHVHDTFNFDHLLIIGDVSLIPAFYGIGNSLNDHTYSTIQGTDYFPDIAVGRFPVFSASDCKTELDKSVNYERHPDISTGNDWFRKATVAASNSYLDNSHGLHMCKFFKNEGFDTIDDLRALIGTFRYDLMQKAFNSGRSWVFYIGHGEPTYWSVQGNYSTGSLEYLYNKNMLPVVVSVACYTSDLDHPSQTLGEKWLSLSEDRGGISFIGATELTEFFYSDTLGKHSIFGYFNRSALTIGAALNYGKMQMYNSFQGGSGSITEETMQQFLLFGDPTLMPWTNIPSLLQADFKKHLTPGVHDISVKVTSDSIPVRNALVCMSTANFQYHQIRYTDSLGNVTFNVTADSNSVYYLTISGYNLVTFEDSIRFDTVNSIPSQISNANISIYPNPVYDNCSISGHTPGRLIERIDITDMNGRLITSFNNIHSYSFTFEKGTMKPGIYFIRITDNSGLYQIRRIAVN